MKLHHKFLSWIIILPVFLLFNKVPAQEVLSPLSDNPIIKQYLSEHSAALSTKKNTYTDTLELPFWDDFSTSRIYPNPEKWMDKAAYINTTLPINPPSLGVATLDIIGQDGAVNPDAGFSVFKADSLTSRYIKLDENPGDPSIFLSFFYQPGGLGEMPDYRDSLVLQFYSPVTEVWSSVWSAQAFNQDTIKEFFATGETKIIKADQGIDSSFNQTIIQVQSEYHKAGFRFRFINYATLYKNDPQSKQGNCDFWHIDYVYLNKGRSINDTGIDDIAFVYPMKSILKNYESMPWQHYLSDTNVPLKENIEVTYRNNDDINRIIDTLSFVFTDVQTGSESYLNAGSYTLSPKQLVNFEAPHGGYQFATSSQTKYTNFLLSSHIVTDAFDSTANNTVAYTQKFHNYYAYDDGSAEYGYGLRGEGSQFGMVAYRFVSLKSDTLQAVNMYFNQIKNNANQGYYFFLNVWDNDNGKPGELLYSQVGEHPEFESYLNQFVQYQLDTPFVVNDTFYVGWQQTTEDLLNIGFDVNRNASEHIFYNIDGNWINTSKSGALMMRPVLGSSGIPVVEVPEIQPTPQYEIRVYPNPANDFIRLSPVSAGDLQSFTLLFYDISGRLVKKVNNCNINRSISVSELNTGIYILRGIRNDQQIFTTRLMIRD